ncbi:MAG: RNA methyltransferase [Sandaracinaceae bacterium]|nr:RNA methyltransferase [Sandaracinaceae bacterium]
MARETQPVVYGLRAVLAVHAHRPEAIERVWYSRDAQTGLQDFFRDLARRRVPYREAKDDELERVAGAIHHEGLVARARARKPPSLEALADRMVKERGFGLALDRVQNPHNLGAIVRSAAFFGATAVVLGGGGQARLGAAAVRIAEGGAELVEIVETSSLASTLATLRSKGVRVIGTDAKAERDPRDLGRGGARLDRPSVVVMGNEREGLARDVRKQCDLLIAIRGAGTLDSLNVSVAAGVVLSALAG